MVKRIKSIVEVCPVYIASRILGKKWTILILQTLMRPRSAEEMRFSGIHRDLDWISPKVLTERLRELEHEGIVQRHVDATTIPPKVSYSLTQKGNDLRGVLEMMQRWGLKYGGSQTEVCLGPGFENCKGCQGRSSEELKPA